VSRDQAASVDLLKESNCQVARGCPGLSRGGTGLRVRSAVTEVGGSRFCGK